MKISFITEIPDNERKKKKLENIWQIEIFETKYLVKIFFLMKTNKFIKSD